jgi:hypothetical protein
MHPVIWSLVSLSPSLPASWTPSLSCLPHAYALPSFAPNSSLPAQPNELEKRLRGEYEPSDSEEEEMSVGDPTQSEIQVTLVRVCVCVCVLHVCCTCCCRLVWQRCVACDRFQGADARPFKMDGVTREGAEMFLRRPMCGDPITVLSPALMCCTTLCCAVPQEGYYGTARFRRKEKAPRAASGPLSAGVSALPPAVQ